MWPVLKSGDFVLVDELPESQMPTPGDLVLRSIGGDPIVHRYLKPGMSKGDRTFAPDPSWGANEHAHVVVGLLPRRYARHRSQLGKVVSLASEPVGGLRRIQVALSKQHARARTRFGRKLSAALLIGNGHLIRTCYYLFARGKRNAVSRDE